MPARHWSPQREFASADFNVKALIDERGCRRDIRSTAGSYFDEKPVRQKKQVFFDRCGFLASAISPGSRPHVKSGPDVFADALVPIAEAPSGVLIPGTRHPDIQHRHRPSMRAQLAMLRLSAMVIVPRNGTVNRIWRQRGKPSKTRDCGISRPIARTARLHPFHRDT
jgi:hypothetical protein